MSPAEFSDSIDAALPQTQCTRCGYADCRAYAEAIVNVGASINRCPPGGAEGIERLAALTGRPALPLDPAVGREGERLLAVIDEAECIGCTLCLKACPVDCIVGAAKSMHTVIEAHCTGCELCIPVCPVDCIALVAATPGRTGWQAWSAAQADSSSKRYAQHRARFEPTDVPCPSPGEPAATPLATDAAPSRSVIEAVLARARAARVPR